MIRQYVNPTIAVLLYICFMLNGLCGAALKPQKPIHDRVKIPARMAASYHISPDETTHASSPNSSATQSINLRGSQSWSNPEIVGYTTYDNQHNGTMGRQVEHRGSGAIHCAWTAQDHGTLGQDRGIGLQTYDLEWCDQYYDHGGARIHDNYAGYVSIDADSGLVAVLGAHEQQIPQFPDVYYPSAYWYWIGPGDCFTIYCPDYPYDIYGWANNNGTGPGNENIWPKIDWHLGTESVLHMVTTESSSGYDFQTISYYRRVGPYGLFDGAVWTDQRVIDTVMNVSPSVTSSPVSDRVAIVWNAPVDYKRDGPDEFDNQYENDVWHALSTNQGADWAHDTVSTNLGASSIGHMVDLGIYDGGNITQFPPESDYKAYCDISALISTQDELHIVWGCRRWSDTENVYRRQSAIFHWAENSPTVIRPVVFATWDTGGECYGHSWGSDAAKMTISECDGKFYVLYSQFGSFGHPCEDFDNVDHVMIGRLYMSVMDPLIGDAWDRPRRVTATPETYEGCTPGDMSGPGDCNSEYWASMARYGRVDDCQYSGENVLDIVYINDYSPGSCIQTESGVWTNNPVMWLTTPCRDVIIESNLHIDPLAVGLCYGQPVFFSCPLDDTGFTITLQNSGLEDINFEIDAEVDSSNSVTNGSNTAIEVDITSGVVPGYGGDVRPEVSITTTGELSNSTVYAHISISHDASGSPPSPFIIPICITIANCDFWGDIYDISTVCKRLRLVNNGVMSNNTENASMDYFDPIDPDDCANIYLYEGSPIICRESGGERRCFFTVYESGYESDHALRAMSPILVDSVSNPSYIKAEYELITADSAIGLRAEYYTPRHPDSCEFIIQRLIWWNRTQEILTDVGVGEYLDWDIPGYSAYSYHNESGFDASNDMVYQYTCGKDPCDTLIDSHRYGGIAPCRGWGWKNFMTLENDIFVWMSGPFGNDAPLPDDTIYGLMADVFGPLTASIDSCEDLSTMVTFGFYDLYPTDTSCAIAILVTSRDDEGGGLLRNYVDMANNFIDDHPELAYCPSLDVIPGDANDDGTIDVGDAVYIINYVFKGGPAPVPYAVCSGDPNGDCMSNVGDAVRIIKWVFGGGPPPVTMEQWISLCGWPIH